MASTSIRQWDTIIPTGLWYYMSASTLSISTLWLKRKVTIRTVEGLPSHRKREDRVRKSALRHNFRQSRHIRCGKELRWALGYYHKAIRTQRSISYSISVGNLCNIAISAQILWLRENEKGSNVIYHIGALTNKKLFLLFTLWQSTSCYAFCSLTWTSVTQSSWCLLCHFCWSNFFRHTL